MVKIEYVDEKQAPSESNTLRMNINRSFVGRNNCSAYTLMNALKTSYEEAEELLMGRTNYHRDRGVNSMQFHDLLRELGWTYTSAKIRTSPTCPKRLPKACILLFNGHVAYYEDGVIYDQFETRRDKRCRQTFGYFTQGVTKIVI